MALSTSKLATQASEKRALARASRRRSRALTWAAMAALTSAQAEEASTAAGSSEAVFA